MKKLDRTLTPEAFPLLPDHLSADSLPLPFSRLIPVTMMLPNGSELTLVEDPLSEVVRIEVLLNAGILVQHQPLQAQQCAQMLREGSKNFTGESISEIFDYHGAYFSAGALPDSSMVNLVVLQRHFDKIMPAFTDLIAQPQFPEKAFHRMMEERRQEFIINQGKLPWEARRHMMNKIFGNQHPYGVIITEKEFINLTTQSLKEFHHEHYLKKGMRMVLTGSFDQHIINKIKETLGSIALKGESAPWSDHHGTDEQTFGEFRIERSGSLQSAIRIGCKAVAMNHPDFIPLQIAVNVLGGYFGSRLNQNLREEKGYTYGIGAGLVSMRACSVFAIGTEVESSVTHEAIKTIRDEIRRLANDPPSESELKQAITFMAGSFLRSIDGSFSLSDRIKAAADHDLDHRFYIDFLNTLNTITPETIANIAKKHLNPEQMVVVRVGK